jgi:hypothetical protein
MIPSICKRTTSRLMVEIPVNFLKALLGVRQRASRPLEIVGIIRYVAIQH